MAYKPTAYDADLAAKGGRTKRLRDTKGFTLVELLVTLAITAVLAGVVTLSLMAYTDYANFKRQNEYAQSLFVAAQNALTHYSENGELDAMNGAMERYAKDKTLESDMLAGEAQGKFDDAKYENRVYYITVNKNGTVYDVPAAEAQQVKDVFDRIFEPYVYDKSILNDASVTIEFDPVGGVVYSVLYSDMKEGFAYGESEKENYISIKNRDYDVRKGIMLGYYGIDDLSDETSRAKEKPVIETVKLVNGNSLDLQFRLTEKYARKATSDLSYQIQLYNAERNLLMMDFSVKNITALYTDPEGKKLTYDQLSVLADVKTYKPDGSENTALKDVKFTAYVDDSHTVHVHLDSVDLAAASALDPSAVSDTYSFHRFGLDSLWKNYTGNIYAKVRATGGRYKPSSVKRSVNTENAYFAAEKVSQNSTAETHSYEVKNARHLYNIRFTEEKTAETGENLINNYNVASSFAWGGENGIFSGENGSEVFGAQLQLNEEADGEKTAFTAINELKKGNTFSAPLDQYTISRLVLRESGTGLGLFAKNSGTIQNVTVAEADVRGADSVGTFCGINGGTLQNLTTIGGTVKGSANVGGIAGSDSRLGSASAPQIVYINNTNGSDVTGSRYVGGIVGQLASSKSQSVLIEGCENTGLITGALGSDADTTKKLRDDLVETLKYNQDIKNLPVNLESWGTDANSMFVEFKKLNGGEYPSLSSYDIEVVAKILEKIDGGKESSESYKKQAAELCENLIWGPCAAQISDGELSYDDTKKYTIVLEAKANKNVSGNWYSRFVYYNGTYYYTLTNNKLGMANFVNKKPIEQLISSPSWIPFTPEISSGSADHPGEGVTTLKNEPSYIGGIIGYADASQTDSSRFQIKDCVSTPETDNAESMIASLLEEDAKWENYTDGALPLLGVYVGGIAGYSEGAGIKGCSTEGGYIVGSNYVGGIVGLEENSDIESSENNADVIGKYYVGGIIGANAAFKGDKDENGFVLPAVGTVSDSTVSNWTNRGTVIATQKYGGGIAGYNTGTLSACAGETSPGQFMADTAKKYGGSYIGGIAGYNIGRVISAKTVNMIPNVYGKDYVGGVIGYNDHTVGGSAPFSTTVYGYTCTGGFVEGGNFVGGVIGLNLSARAFLGQDESTAKITANLNRVKGNYYVGGAIGGNIVGSQTSFKNGAAATGDTVEVSAVVDNFLGTVEAKAFAGGYIGYNMTAESVKIAGDYAAKMAEYREDNRSAAEKLSSGDYRASDSVSVNINGQGGGCKLQGVTAEVYAGGILGFNNPATKTNISDAVNKTPVTGTSSISIAELADVKSGEKDFDLDPYTGGVKTYSYAGGIVGKATEKMVIDSCSSDDSGRVTASGTYLGGLVEVNEGLVKNCNAVNLGNNGRNYVGGVIGLNKSGGKIEEALLNGKTIVGADAVGGITAENFGDIYQVEYKENAGSVYGYGENIGGLAGASYGGFTVDGEERSASVSNYLYLEINVGGAGVNVGGAVGLNSGTVKNLSLNGGAVSGETNAGGMIGLQQGGSLSALSNYFAPVTAAYGYGGGVVGEFDGGEITNCSNMADVKVLGARDKFDSFAGGLIGALLKGTADKCENQGGSVVANKGGAGGVAGVNKGMIQNQSNSNASEVKGELYAGGVAAVNYGTVSNSDSGKNGRVSEISDFSGVGDGCLGGIAGLNEGSVVNCAVNGATLVSNSVNTKVGGVAGLNNGEVRGTDNGAVYGTVLKFAKNDLSYYGYMGGVAGVNSGSISGYTVGNDGLLGNTEIYGSANNPEKPPKYDPNYDYEKDGAVIYGYGGIAGFNGAPNPDDISAASITDCVVAGLNLTATGDSYNITNLGGVAGVNGTGAEISGISFVNGSIKDTEITTAKGGSSYAYAGGVAGYNNGRITDVNYKRTNGFGDGSTNESEAARKASAESVSEVKIHVNKGHTGGIVGLNKQSGSVSRSATGSGWSITVDAKGQDNGAGGIIGYNSSSNPITDCDNRADVKKEVSDSVGGIIGRNEVVTGTWYMENCNNFGELTGIRVGGIIGCLKYNGGTLLNCSNYGRINGINEGAGGMIGMIYDVTKNTVLNITSCKNFGEIAGKGSDAAGIVAYVALRCQNIRLVVSDCVNTGLISSAATNIGGIVARNDAASAVEETDGKTLVLNNCRNFGLPTKAANFSGIVQKTNMGRTTVKNCVGVAGRTDAATQAVVKPIGDSSESNKNNDNYYFTESETTSTQNAGLGTPLYLEGDGGVYNAFGSDSKKAVFAELDFGTDYTEFMADYGTGLTVLGGDNNRRQFVYLNIDGKLIQGNKQAQRPKDLEVSDNGGSVALKWDVPAKDAYKYEIRVTVEGEAEPRMYTSFDKSFELSAAGLEGKKIVFEVRSVSPLGKTSPYSNAVSYTVPAKTLPAPKIRFVLSSLTKTKYYKAVLDNAADYAEFGEVLVEITSKDNSRFGKITVRLKDGVAANENEAGFDNNDGAGATNYMITAQAVKADGNTADVGKSPAVTRESMVPNTTDWISDSKKMGTVSANSFTGITPESLAYHISVKGPAGSGNYATFYRSELLAVDADGLGVPVVYAYGDISVLPDTTSKTQLNNLPADLGNSGRYGGVSVRSYPISMANQIVYSGYEIGSGYTEDKLKKLHVSEDGKIIESTEDADLLIHNGVKKNGYVIYKNGSTYSLWFNSLIYNSEKAGGTGADYSADYNTQVQSYRNINNKSDYPKYSQAFELSANYDDAAQKYTAAWAGVSGSTYNYTLTGETKDGSLDTFKEGTITASGNGNITIEESTVKWQYKNVTLKVDKMGKEVGGKTTEFGAAGSKTVGTRLKLTTIPVPYASLKDSYGIVYNVSWNGITDPTELSCLEGYNLILESDIQTASGPKTVTAVYRADANTDSMEVDLNSVTGTAADGTEYTGYVGGNTPVKLRVIAVAKSGQEEYGNSADEELSFKLTLPERLNTPLAADLSMDPKSDVALSVEDFEAKGFKLTYKDTMGRYDPQFTGQFQLAAEVYSSDGSNRIAEIAPKDAPLTMSGNKLSEEAVYTLTKNDGFTSLYAGQILRIYVRAVSNNSIASLWSEKIDLLLPNVKVDAVDADTSHSMAETDAKVYQNGGETDWTRKVSQDQFRWVNSSYTKGYELLLTRIGDSTSDSYKKIVDKLSVTNGSTYGDAPVVSFVDVENSDITTAVGEILKPTQVKKEDSYTLYTYDLGAVREQITDSGLEVELKYELTVKVNSDGKPVDGVPGIKSTEYELTLPDAKIPAYEDIEGSAAKNVYRYNEVSFVSVADKGISIAFENSEAAVTKRAPENTGDFKAVTDPSEAKIIYAKQMSYYVLEQNEISARETVATDPIKVTPIIIVTPTPDDTPSPTATPEPSGSPSPTPEPTPSGSPTPAPTVTPEPTAEPTPEATPSGSPEPTPAPTVTPEPTAEPTPEPTSAPTTTPEPTAEPTPEPTAEPTPEPTAEPSPEPSPGPSPDPVSNEAGRIINCGERRTAG